ncbi:hypothetical protein Q0F99_12965 [Rathayibacter oskolensis]|uniref:hypothetical protein n=1 Tax=Rathayibacter oskolensis TaxID=1891671 RepID=UPI00265F3AC2|nr:hypothetical protein [Rathayibacter oskolensis]WKK70703.1 hypothetical protein Q0F99_12965 [Rathayibacter oskolensis]
MLKSPARSTITAPRVVMISGVAVVSTVPKLQYPGSQVKAACPMAAIASPGERPETAIRIAPMTRASSTATTGTETRWAARARSRSFTVTWVPVGAGRKRFAPVRISRA